MAGAVLLGLGSMVGTGVFVSLALAAGLAGAAVPWTVAIAAVVAMCNGLSSAQLAAANPVAGGTYEYGYRYLHPVAGLTAGWLFILAKSASAATAALGIAAYAGLGARRLPALAALVVVTVLVLMGIRRSNQANVLIVLLSVGALVAVSTAAWGEAWAAPTPAVGSFPDVAEAAALVFVAFTGYGRVATLGEEIRNPRTSIPRAVVATVVVTALLYVVVAFVLSRLGTGGLGDGSPLVAVATAAGGGVLEALVRAGALAAMVGVLLNLILGLSRVVLAMGRRRDLPAATAVIHRGGRTPTVAILSVAAVVAAFVLIGSIAVTWSFSALTVLVYYALTNLAALRQPPEERRVPLAVQAVGLIGCLALAVFLEPVMWLWAAGLIAIGVIWHYIRR
ncbi:MAG TPA: APC family permease [Acidimicrobiia bacterium]|jgi:APA family basic amino acid/polyamine antiporter